MLLWVMNMGFAGGDGVVTPTTNKSKFFIQNVNKIGKLGVR
jgi:hypothetical protein